MTLKSQWPNLHAQLEMDQKDLEAGLAQIFAVNHHFHKTLFEILKWFEYMIYQLRHDGHNEEANGLRKAVERFKKIADAKKRVRT